MQIIACCLNNQAKISKNTTIHGLRKCILKTTWMTIEDNVLLKTVIDDSKIGCNDDKNTDVKI